ncbi:hypothetical protein [Chitinophaga rhizophila]|uniref:LTXXQ motif family protein n=1 Tax=Chitinophaga rhizophila TaxID=2866212 RepID=A0ABS7GKL3_9BACT|nr:hypothetical protein [Chitinophaga rhizophila]MBW8686968.1 hypothetical protein [Chitinophaga rhizophila]
MKRIILTLTMLVTIAACSDTKHVETAAAPDIVDTTSDMSSEDPDATLATELFEGSDNYRYVAQRKMYIRWDLEKETLRPLFSKMFSQHDQYKKRLRMIEDNQLKFLEDARKEMTATARQYGSVSGTPEFEYLVAKKDAAFRSLMEEMVEDENVSEEEKDSLRKALESM